MCIRDRLLQFAALVKLQGNVATADQFAADIDLGKSGPVGVARQVIENLRIFHHVHVGERQAGGRQRLGRALRETAARHLRGAFHVDNHWIGSVSSTHLDVYKRQVLGSG